MKAVFITVSSKTTVQMKLNIKHFESQSFLLVTSLIRSDLFNRLKAYSDMKKFLVDFIATALLACLTEIEY